MGKEDCSDCKYYDSVTEIKKKLEENNIENTKQDSSLKSIHKRLDEDGIKRNAMHEKINEIAVEQSTSSQAVVDHMEWEEKHQKLVFKVGVIALSIIVTVMGWTLIEVLDIEKEGSSVQTLVNERIKLHDKRIVKVDKYIENQNKTNNANLKLLYSIQANQQQLINRDK